MYPHATSERYSSEEVEGSLELMIKHVNAAADKVKVAPAPQLAEATLAGAKLSANFNNKHKMVDTRSKVYLIKRFEDIGWKDPFPDEPMKVEYKLKDNGKDTMPGGDGQGPQIPPNKDVLCYAETRLIPKRCPTVIYVPSKEMMFKMMRACIGVKKKEDLWIYNQGSAQCDHDHGHTYDETKAEGTHNVEGEHHDHDHAH